MRGPEQPGKGSDDEIDGRVSRPIGEADRTGIESARVNRDSPPSDLSAVRGEGSARKDKPRRKVLITLMIVVGFLAVVGGGMYFYYASQFVSTDNAQVDGDKIEINAPATGILTNWKVDTGTDVRTGEIVGRITMLGSFAQAQQPIKAPGAGQVAINRVVNGDYVTANQSLATAYDFSKIYITARVDETDIRYVQEGDAVDIDVDALSGIPITGIVQDVQGSSSGTFSLFPQNNSSGNFQKVTQVIPVKIALTNTDGKQLLPGENVTIHIRKHQN